MAAGHMTTIVREQREVNAGVQLTFSIHLIQDVGPEDDATPIRMHFHLS